MGKNNKGDYDARVAVKNLRDVTARFDNRYDNRQDHDTLFFGRPVMIHRFDLWH